MYFTADQFGADDTFVIPGSVIDGDVLIEGLFVENGKGMKRSKVTYNIKLDGRIISTQEYTVTVGSDYPAASVSSEASEEYYTLSGFPEGTVPEEDVSVDLVLVQTLPFEVSTAIDESTVWYTISLTADKRPLVHDASRSYIDLSAGGSGVNAQWAFIGNVIDGFRIVNRGAGEGYVLSSATAITSSNDGSVYAVMTPEPVPDGHNTFWIPTKSSSLSGEPDGFYLHQLGFLNNRLNSRNNRLAYWVGGADGGSTFTAAVVDESMPDIDYCVPQPVSGRSVSGSITNRTDRYLSYIEMTDQTNSISMNGFS